MYCVKCKKKIEGQNYIDKEGVCNICNGDEIVDDIVQISLPGGIVAFWIGTSGYISKEKNQRYFNIPDGVKQSIIHGKDYKILVQEL